MSDTSIISPPLRSAGRPREFDIEEALDKAIVVFSERGYHGASISDLSAAMGLTAGSLYKAFADKKAIFLAAFDRYKQVRNALLEEALAGAFSGRDRLHRLLRFYADAAHGAAGRRGCMVVGTAAELAAFDAEAAERVARSQARSESLIAQLIREGQSDGSVSRSIEPAVTARLIFCILQGIRIAGKTGQDRSQAMATADSAMKLFD
jgi:AcrR family transcriptional regulator